MSKLVEEMAMNFCRENNMEGFCSKDTKILQEIYDRAKMKKGFKCLKHEFPKHVNRRIRNAMRTTYYFSNVSDKRTVYYTLKTSTITNKLLKV